jgi:DNA end-binding protein Ku
MAARPIWNGAISFGMVVIPVKLFTATESKDISFHLIHEECGSRIKQVRWCPVDDREVPYDELARGYEYAKGEHVLLSEEDFEKLPLASKHTIELNAFVDAKQIDPIYYEKSYYLEPTEVGVKPYALLMRALEEKGLTAVAKLAIRNKERLCALRPADGTLMLETLYYPDEIRAERTQIEDVKVSDAELKMAFSLIDAYSEDFAPEKYHDEYREALMELIEAKLQNREVVEQPEPAASNVTDLMAALRASVAAAKKAKGEEKEPAPSKRRKAG